MCARSNCAVPCPSWDLADAALDDYKSSCRAYFLNTCMLGPNSLYRDYKPSQSARTRDLLLSNMPAVDGGTHDGTTAVNRVRLYVEMLCPALSSSDCAVHDSIDSRCLENAF